MIKQQLLIALWLSFMLLCSLAEGFGVEKFPGVVIKTNTHEYKWFKEIQKHDNVLDQTSDMFQKVMTLDFVDESDGVLKW